MQILKTLFNHTLNFLYPSSCRKCDIIIPEQDVLCDECFITVASVASKKITVGGYDVAIYAASTYEGIMRKLVCGKLHGDKVAGVDLARILIKRRLLAHAPLDCFVPIPLHWTRYAYRGFNQAAVMAQKLASHYNANVCDVLRRTRRTAFQSHIAQSEREKNVKDAFSLSSRADEVAGKHVVIVDDLMTTGATLTQAVRVLARCKPASLSVVVACRAQ